MNPERTTALALRISVTDRCQLRCNYCMPPEGVACGPRETILTYEEIAALTATLQAAYGLAKIRLTGGEPLLRPDVDRLVGMLTTLGVDDIAITTNGLQLAALAPALKAAGLRRVNVSLDALAPDRFRHLTGGGDVAAVLAGIAAAQAAGLTPVKLNTVVIRDVNDAEAGDLLAYALAHACELRFIELMPIGPGRDRFPDGFIAAHEIRERLQATGFTLRPLGRSPDSSADRYAVTDAHGREGTVGFIASCSAPFCAGCRRLRITADGRLIGCLAREGGISVREHLRNDDTAGLLGAVQTAMGGKRSDTRFEQDRSMSAIGG